MSETETKQLTLLKLTVTETHEYDRAAVLAFAADNDITLGYGDEDDLVIEVFDRTDGSLIGDELFGSLADQDSSKELLTRGEDD